MVKAGANAGSSGTNRGVGQVESAGVNCCGDTGNDAPEDAAGDRTETVASDPAALGNGVLMFRDFGVIKLAQFERPGIPKHREGGGLWETVGEE